MLGVFFFLGNIGCSKMFVFCSLLRLCIGPENLASFNDFNHFHNSWLFKVYEGWDFVSLLEISTSSLDCFSLIGSSSNKEFNFWACMYWVVLVLIVVWHLIWSFIIGSYRIGTEHEKFGFEIGTLRPMKYEQIAELLNGISERFDWDKIMEGENIIGLKQVCALFSPISSWVVWLNSQYSVYAMHIGIQETISNCYSKYIIWPLFF